MQITYIKIEGLGASEIRRWSIQQYKSKQERFPAYSSLFPLAN